MSENTVKQRLVQYLQYKHIGQNKFERLAGLSNGYISNLKSSPSPEKLTKIIRASEDLNRDWLLYGEGEMLRQGTAADARTVPLIPVEAFAGPIQYYLDEGVQEYDCRRVVSPVPGTEFAIPVSGDSMSPDIPDGATLFVSRINDAAFIPWGNVMVLDTVNGALVKRIYPSKNSNDAVEARSINSEYPPFDVPKSSIRAIYRVLAHSKFYPTM